MPIELGTKMQEKVVVISFEFTYQCKLANSWELKQKLGLIEMWDFYFNDYIVDIVDAFNWMLQWSKGYKNGCRRFFFAAIIELNTSKGMRDSC